ncbi:Utp14 protein-domain-containing protein [Phaeosphaeriaceae sp. PMI808]|nr:Utp14 protein-domain-containing protein [Phaeosphaeriaceae sp. PMI808]
MPPRVARSSLQNNQPKKPRTNTRNPRKAAKRALNAFSIAQYENPEKAKISRNRLGEIDPSFQRKRARDDDDEDEDDEDDDDAEPKRRKRKSGEETFDSGSDSEGNTWTMGHIDVDDDDDESIDSDEAFGESDEERFEDFAFRGSSANQKKKSRKPRRQQELDDDDDGMDLDEGDSADGEDEGDDNLGEDAIDLATALDQYEEDEAEERRRKEKKAKKQMSAFDDSDEAPSEGEDVATDGASDFSSDDDVDDEEDRQAQLNDLISSLATESEAKSKGRRVEVHESAVPDEFGVSRKVDLLSFKPKVADAEKKQALKLLRDDKSSKRTDIARKLEAPLPKRQQDKLDRAAANAKANETLDRWTDTIKQNRRAEHLVFPLQNQGGGQSVGETRLQPTSTSAPTNDLEATIQSILEQSGLSNGADDEEKIRKAEELEMNKRPIEEVMANRAKLRMARELAFREEIRAKRIKKIKSKAYRRVHRKEREKLLEKERSQLKDDGVDLSEEEREYNDRRRAEERMGAKHRESKWAKGIKATGRAAWDQDALDGVTEMARRNEELRRRVEGKTIRDEDEGDSDLPSEDEEESEDGSESGDDTALQQSISKLKHNPFSTDNSKLGQMAFMQRAEAAKRAQNDEDIERTRRELAGEDSASEEGENATKIGRRTYGPGKDMEFPRTQFSGNDLEEQPGSDEENASKGASAEEVESITNGSHKTKGNGLENGRKSQRSKSIASTKPAEDGRDTHNPFLAKAKKEKKNKEEGTSNELLALSKPEKAAFQRKPKAQATANAETQQSTVDSFLQQRVTAADDDGWATVLGGQDFDGADDQSAFSDSDSDAGIDLTNVRRNQALTAKGFAGDNEAASFALEKEAAIQEDSAKEVTSYLPGWGAWIGDSMSAKEKARNKGQKTITKTPGLDASKRRDKKLDRVIINERRAKPTVKYMASQLPFPFENREQYERSLRVPKGLEWTTKRTFQDATRPRVIVKRGIIEPLRKPLV